MCSSAHLPGHLASGYSRFQRNHFGPNRAHYEALSNAGQKPSTMVIGCCDSRVRPDTIFGAEPGDIFVVRNVANLVPPSEDRGRYHGVSAALEFAVKGLGIATIVVMGHSRCGGIQAVLNEGANPEPTSDYIGPWMSILTEARDGVVADMAGASAEAKQAELERRGIAVSIENLRTFPFISSAEQDGRLALVGAHFDIASGRLEVLDNRTGEFAPEPVG